MKTIANETELIDVIEKGDGIIFLDVEWSQSAHISREAIEDIEADTLPVIRVDISSQRGSIWQWLKNYLDRYGISSDVLYDGNGELLFVRDGIPKKIEKNIGKYSKQELKSKLLDK